MHLNDDDFFSARYLNASNLKPGRRTIRDVEREMIGTPPKAKLVIYFKEDDRGLPANKTNYLALVNALGRDTDRWPGRVVALKLETVAFQGKMTNAIRIHPAPAAAPARSAPPEPEEQASEIPPPDHEHWQTADEE